MTNEEKLEALVVRAFAAKAAEKAAYDERRRLEDEIATLSELDNRSNGVRKIVPGLKAVCKINEKVDSDRLQEIAKDKGLSEYLGSLFKWSPSINKRAWDSTSDSIKTALEGAITRAPARPTFKYEEKKEK